MTFVQTESELPGGLEGLGAAMLRAAGRKSGRAAGEAARDVMRAITAVFSKAREKGSICVRSEDVKEALGAEGTDVFERGLVELEALGLLQNLEDFLDLLPEGKNFAPIVLDDADGDSEGAKLYFSRFAYLEIELAQALLRLGGAEADMPLSVSQQETVDRVTSSAGADDRQRLAVRRAVSRRLSVISGGPGTGKTTTVAQIIECLLDATPDLRIALAAPTGKAAGRMEQSLMQSAARQGFGNLKRVRDEDALRRDADKQIRSRTIHKWLFSPTGAGAFPSADNPIEADLFIIDEASMVDIHLARRLLTSIGNSTRVILLGDKHQLAAVGPGAVFAELSDPKGPLGASVTELVLSRRFGEGTPIAELAQAINHQGACAALPEEEVFDRVLEVFREKATAAEQMVKLCDVADRKKLSLDSEELFAFNSTGLTREVREWLDKELDAYGQALAACRQAFLSGADEATWKKLRRNLWDQLAQFRALAAHRHGPMSVMAVNDYADLKMRSLWPLAQEGADGHYPGQVVIVRRNDEGLGVHNGDVGIVLPKFEAAQELEDEVVETEDGVPVVPVGEARSDRKAPSTTFSVYFGDSETELPAVLLPSHDTAWAITIHQSQGSEFDRVAVLMPPKADSGLATRELLYTAVTRTRSAVDVFSSIPVLREAVAHPTLRDGSLGRRLSLGKIELGK